MVTVPLYQQTERLRPAFQQGVDVRASADAFGASIGRGMQNVAAGGMQLAESVRQVEDLKATLVAKDGLTAFEREKMELDYGPNGFMTTQGRNAVEGRANYNQALEDLKKKHAPQAGLAANKYEEAATAAVTQGMRSGIIHSAQGQKDWAASSSNARLALYTDQALAGYDKPDEVRKSIGLGFAEIDEQARLMGWGPEAVELKRKELSSTIHSNVAIALASKPNGARAALDYVKANSGGMDTKTRMDIETKLKPFADDEEALAEWDKLSQKGRTVSSVPGDIVGEVAGVDRSAGGPTRSKAFLMSKSAHKDRPGDTSNLDDSFADNLAALIQDAPAGIREGLGLGSAYRSNELQKDLFENSDKSGRRVAFPAGYEKPDGTIAKGSNHLHGRAADLTYNGLRLDKAPKEVRDWVHANAGNYGLRFPMSWEPWHIEPNGGAPGGGTVVPARDGVAVRSSMPSVDDVIARAQEIKDPNVRAAFIKQANANLEMRSKAQSARTEEAKTQIWTMMMQNTPLSAIPLDLKIAAGREAVSGFMEFESKAGDVTTNPVAYSNLSTLAATNPDAFTKLDMTAPEIINSLSRQDWKAMSDKKTSILGDERKAREEALVLTTAFSQAGSQLEAVGISTTGKEGKEREEAARRIAQFQNALSAQMDEFKKANNKAPSQMDIQSMINRLLLPIAIKSPGTLYGENTWTPDYMRGGWFSSPQTRVFDAAKRPDGTTVDVVVEYSDIPIDLRRGIATDLERDLGRKPSEQEVVQRYEDFILNR